MASRRALERARNLVGTHFRPQGRDAPTGLDCVGLVIAAFGLSKHRFPDDYRMGGRGRFKEMQRTIDRHFRRAERPEIGMLVVWNIGSRQMHLGVVSPSGAVHADARRGMVVEGPHPPGAIVVGYYRKRRAPQRNGAY